MSFLRPTYSMEPLSYRSNVAGRYDTINAKKYYRQGFNGAEALKKKFVEAEGAVEAVAEVVGGAAEGGHLGSLRHGVLSTDS